MGPALADVDALNSEFGDTLTLTVRQDQKLHLTPAQVQQRPAGAACAPAGSSLPAESPAVCRKQEPRAGVQVKAMQPADMASIWKAYVGAAPAPWPLPCTRGVPLHLAWHSSHTRRTPLAWAADGARMQSLWPSFWGTTPAGLWRARRWSACAAWWTRCGPQRRPRTCAAARASGARGAPGWAWQAPCLPAQVLMVLTRVALANIASTKRFIVAKIDQARFTHLMPSQGRMYSAAVHLGAACSRPCTRRLAEAGCAEQTELHEGDESVELWRERVEHLQLTPAQRPAVLRMRERYLERQAELQVRAAGGRGLGASLPGLHALLGCALGPHQRIPPARAGAQHAFEAGARRTPAGRLPAAALT